MLSSDDFVIAVQYFINKLARILSGSRPYFKTSPMENLFKPLPILLLLTLVGTLLGVWLLRGFDPEGEGALFTEYRGDLPKSYFATPERAVRKITDLLDKEDWSELTQHYDHENSGIKLDRFLSGDFFMEKAASSVGHASGIDPYRHPFAPGFRFQQTAKTTFEDVFEVTVVLEIEQGDGAPSQRTLRHFYLKRYPEGYRVLPRSPYAPVDTEAEFDKAE